ncbi:hypothetical protein ACLOJK_032931 [Asimina triloba]
MGSNQAYEELLNRIELEVSKIRQQPYDQRSFDKRLARMERMMAKQFETRDRRFDEVEHSIRAIRHQLHDVLEDMKLLSHINGRRNGRSEPKHLSKFAVTKPFSQRHATYPHLDGDAFNQCQWLKNSQPRVDQPKFGAGMGQHES